MKNGLPPFEEVVAFHGHSCPGLAIGYRAAAAGLSALQVDRPKDEELVAIVENDACGIDAIQFVAGTTLGKGNLIFRDYGKRAYTFINRKTGEAVRVAERYEFSEQKGDPRLAELRPKVFSGRATAAEEEEFGRLTAGYVRHLLTMPEEEMFAVTRVKVEIPERARIFRSIRCADCGETVAESRARVQEGKIVCIPCFEHYDRGWG
ncbi:MAG: formylmethanofuran dehydrogenase [Methanomicrobiales archaeon]|nr:formylmethanofuran dehydrogenase [Methanomicrobiales archaeon]